MNQENPQSEKNQEESFLSRYDTVLSFLSLEVLCFGFFALGGQTGLTVFRLLGFFLSFVTIGFLTQHQTKEERKGYWVSLIPFLAFALLYGLSRFFLGGYSNVFSAFALDIGVSLGLIGFFLLGQSLKAIPCLKRDVVLLSVLGMLALMVLIPGLYSLIRYGFFYAARYKGMVYYYEGVVFPIDNETKILDGFSFLEASLAYGKAPAFLLSLSLPGCLFVNPKKDTKRFLIILGFGLIGLLDLAFVPYYRALILSSFVFLMALVYKGIRHSIEKRGSEKRAEQVLKILYFTLIGVASLGVILLFVDSFTGAILGSIPWKRIQASRETGGIFRIEEGIRAVFVEESATGKALNLLGILFGVSYLSASGSMLGPVGEINFLWQNGLIAFLLLLFVIFFFVRECRRFLKKDPEKLDGKVIVVAILFGAFLYFSLLDDEMPLHHATSFLPLSRNSLTLLVSFLCGLVYQGKWKEARHE